MKPSKLLLLLWSALSLTGCNAVLGIEKGKVQDKSPVVCPEGNCPQSCKNDEDCKDGAVCLPGACTALGDAGPEQDGEVDPPDGEVKPTELCTEGELRCEGAALPTRLQCMGGEWKSGAACEDGKLCDSQASTPGECKAVVDVCLGQKPNQAFCFLSERVSCGPDLVSATTKACSSSAHCNLGTGPDCAVCKPGEARCEGDKLLLCKADLSGFEEKETCNVGECKAQLARCTSLSCDPEAYSCAGNVLEHCNATGSGYLAAERKDCGAGVCDSLNAQCDQCEANMVLGCGDSNGQLLCDADGQSQRARACADLSISTPICVGGGVCVQCALNSKSCQDPATVLSCSGQGIPTATACTGTTCVAGKGCVGECASDEAKCAGTAAGGRTICGPEGMFIASEPCEANTLCDNASGKCKPIVEGCAGRAGGEVVCVGSTRIVCGPDLVSTTSSEQCGSAELCALGTGPSCAKCSDETFECQGVELFGCNATHTALEKRDTCSSASLCNTALGRCTSQVCEADRWYCTTDGSNTLRRCNADGSAYLPGTPCGSGTCDAVNAQCDSCKAGDPTGCSGNSRLRCNSDGQGTTPEACTSPSPICTGIGRCVQCQPSSNTCSSDQRTAYHCDANGTQTAETCPSNRTCVGGSCTGTCGPGQYQCPQAESPARDLCNAQGSFATTTACPANNNCERNTSQCKAIAAGCAGRREGDWVCSGLDRVQCGRDLVSISTAGGGHCASAALCSASTGATCAECLAGQTRCNQAQPQSCSGGVWVNQGAACVSAALCNQTTGLCGSATCTPNVWSCKSDGKGHQQCNPDGTGFIANSDACGYCNPASPSVCYACKPGDFATTCFSGTQRSQCNAQGNGYAGVACTTPGTICTGSNQCVQCTASRCQDAGTWLQCNGGMFQSQTCSATTTCLTDSVGCAGQCRVGNYRCNSTTKNPETCINSNGTAAWQQTATCNVPTQICQASASSSTCVVNSAYPLGASDAGPSWNPWRPLNEIWAVRVVPTITSSARGLYVTGSMAAGACDMAIYSESGGRPSTYLTGSTVSGIGIVAGTAGGNISGNVTLTAGTPYWVAAICGDGSAAAPLYWTSRSGASAYWAEYTFGVLPPSMFPVGTRVLDRAYSIYMTARQIP